MSQHDEMPIGMNDSIKIAKPPELVPGGANRFPTGRDYSQISDAAIDLLAETQHEGNTKYGPGNWRKGIPVSNLLSHAINHLFKFQNGDISEGGDVMRHLAHALWNLEKAAHFIKYRPELIDVEAIVRALNRRIEPPLKPGEFMLTMCWFCHKPIELTKDALSASGELRAHARCVVDADLDKYHQWRTGRSTDH